MPGTTVLSNSRPSEVRLSPDGSLIYSADTDGHLRVYNALTGALVNDWQIGQSLGGMDISPDGSYLILTDRNVDLTYKVDATTGAKTSYGYTPQGYESTLFDVAVLSDGTALFTQNAQGSGFVSYKVLNFSTGVYSSGSNVGQSSVLSRDATGSYVIIGEENLSTAPIDLYHTGSGIVATEGNALIGDFNWGIQAFSGTYVADYLYSQGVEIYDSALHLVTTLPYWKNGEVTDLAFSADGQSLYVLDNVDDAIIQIRTSDWSITGTVLIGADVGQWLGQVGATHGSRLIADPQDRYFTVASDTQLLLVQANVIHSVGGTNQADSLVGTAGADVIYGFGGDDTLTGNGGNDILHGGDGNDQLVGGPGDNILDGGNGTDTVSYADATNGVTVNLSVTTGQNTGWGSDQISNVEILTGSSYDDVLTAGSGTKQLHGGDGSDTLVLDGVPAGTLTGLVLDGGTGTDTLEDRLSFAILSNTTLTSIEQIKFDSQPNVSMGINLQLSQVATAGLTDLIGGPGFDYLAMLAPASNGATYTMPAFNLVNWNGDLVALAAYGSGSVTLNARDGLAGQQSLAGGDGNDTLNGSNGSDSLDGGGGTNALYGNDGNDTLSVTNTTSNGTTTNYNGAGIYDGGSGSDELLIGGPVNFVGALSSIETIALVASNPLFPTGTNLAIGASTLNALAGPIAITGAGTITVNLAAGDSFDARNLAFAPGSLVSLTMKGSDSAANVIHGSSVTETINGGSLGDLIYAGTGIDTLNGNGGDDGFYFGPNLTAADSVDGGAGNDQVGLQGDYSGGLTLGASSLVNVETLVLLPGSDSRFGDTAGNFYSYDLTTNDANVGSGQLLTVNFNTLRVGENVAFNGSAETDGSFLTYGGYGNDVITGGQQPDGFYFGQGRFGAGDVLDGQGGSDQLGLQGDYSGANAIHFGATQLTSIETIVLLSGADTRFGGGAAAFSYDLTMDDGNIGEGAALIVNANTLRSDETLAFNGAAESDGRFQVFSGAGNDTIVGGSGNDTIYGGAGADTLTGGPGADTFAYLSAAHSTATAMDHITDFATGDVIDLTRIDAIAGGSDDPFTFIGSAAFTHTAGQLSATDQGGGVWLVQGDVDGDGVADLVISVTTDHALSAGDFLL